MPTATSPGDRRSSAPTAPAQQVTDRWRARLAEPRTLSEAEGLALLADYGVPVMPHRVVTTAHDAVAAATELSLPVVLKTATDGILHKSEVRGVLLNLTDVDAVREAYLDLEQRLGPDVLVAPMLLPG